MVRHYPKDWRIVFLSELSIEGFQNGLFYEITRKSKGIPIINVGDLYKSSPITSDKLELFNATAEEIKRYQVFNGDLFFTRSSIVPSGIAFCNWYRCSEKKAVVFDSHVVRFKTNTDIVNPMYLYLACIGPDARKYFLANAKTATMTTIDQTVLGKCPIPYPTLKEQAAIAEAISDADNLISSLQKLIEKKKAIKQGAMQELLAGKKRLNGFHKEWVYQSLGSLGELSREVINPQLFPGTSFYEYSMPAYHDGRNPKKTQGQSMHSTRLKICGEVILFNKLNVRQRRVWHVKDCLVNAICSSEFLPYHALEVLPEFLYQVLLNDKTTNDFENMSTGTSNSQKRITPNDFLDYQIFLPGKDEQRAIAQVLSDMDNEIEQLEKKLSKYKQIKQGMMQELLTGRIRLVEKKEKIQGGD